MYQESNNNDYSSDDDKDFDQFAYLQQAMADNIIQNVMNSRPTFNQVEDDAQEIQDKGRPQQKVDNKKQLTQEEQAAKQLKYRDARKYFEIVKLQYLSHVCSSLNQVKYINQNCESIAGKFLSCLNIELISEFFRLKKIKLMSLQISSLLSFIKKAKNYLQQTKKDTFDWSQIFHCLCETLKLSCRKIHFFDVQNLVSEVFYKIKYQANERQRKKQNKKTKEQQIIKIHLDKKIQQNLQRETSSNQYLFLQDFQFDPQELTKQSRSQQAIKKKESQADILNARRQNNFKRRKNYKNSYFFLYSISDNNWVLVNSEILQVQKIEEFKSYILEGKFILGFYSTRIIHFRQEYQNLKQIRDMKDIVLQDLTMYFYDKLKDIKNRRKRIGVLGIMRQIFNKASYQKHYYFLTSYDQYIQEKIDQSTLSFHLQNFPANKKDMLMSDYFIVPSMISQYLILDPLAQPIQREFNQEKVYFKKDLIPVSSKNGWIDKGRKVRLNQVPVKKVQNKSQNMTQLFLFEQTQPYTLSFDEQTDNFISDDQYNNIYLPPNFIPQQRFTIINKKISYVCNKAKIRHVQLVQGFVRNIGRILPNYIGFLVFKEDVERIMQLYEERQSKLLQNKNVNRQKELVSIWNRLFKKIELSEWSKSFENKT